MATPIVVGAENPTGKNEVKLVPLGKIRQRQPKLYAELETALKAKGFYLSGTEGRSKDFNKQGSGGMWPTVIFDADNNQVEGSEHMIFDYVNSALPLVDVRKMIPQIISRCLDAKATATLVVNPVISDEAKAISMTDGTIKPVIFTSEEQALIDSTLTEVSGRMDNVSVSILSKYQLSDREKSLNKANAISQCWLEIEKLMTRDAQTAWELGEQFYKLSMLGLSYREISDRVGKGKSWVESCVANFSYYLDKGDRRVKGFNWQTHDLTRRAQKAVNVKLDKMGIKVTAPSREMMDAVLKSNSRTTKGAEEAIVGELKRRSFITDDEAKAVTGEKTKSSPLTLIVENGRLSVRYYGHHFSTTLGRTSVERFSKDLMLIKQWYDGKLEEVDASLKRYRATDDEDKNVN